MSSSKSSPRSSASSQLMPTLAVLRSRSSGLRKRQGLLLKRTAIKGRAPALRA